MKGRQSKLPPPYLRSVWLDQSRVADPTIYPFCLPFLSNGFQLDFGQAITIIIGEKRHWKIDAAGRHCGTGRL